MPSESFHLEDGYNEEIQSLQPNSAEEIPCVPTRRQRNLFHLSTLQFTLKRHACLISICILFLFMIGIYISTYENRESLQPGILGDDLNEQIPRSQGLSDLQTVLEERTETVVGLGNSIVANVTPVALNQIQSFRDGSGLIINIVSCFPRWLVTDYQSVQTFCFLTECFLRTTPLLLTAYYSPRW
jgi:hypothetical protein